MTGEQTTQAPAADNNRDGDKPAETSTDKELDSVVERVANENQQLAKLLDERAVLLARAKLGGTTVAGAKPRTVDDDIDDKVKKLIAASKPR